MTIYGRVFVVQWSRGGHVYSQHFVNREALGVPSVMRDDARDDEGSPLAMYAKTSSPKEDAIRYARERINLGGSATVYEVIDGIYHKVEVHHG